MKIKSPRAWRGACLKKNRNYTRVGGSEKSDAQNNFLIMACIIHHQLVLIAGLWARLQIIHIVDYLPRLIVRTKSAALIPEVQVRGDEQGEVGDAVFGGVEGHGGPEAGGFFA